MSQIKGTIVDLEDQSQRIDFWSFEPPGNSVQPNYEHQTVRGRSSPHRFYSSTGPETWNFSIKLLGSIEAGSRRTNYDVWKEHLFIKSFAFPDYGQSRTGPTSAPHRALIRWGQSINLIGVILSPTFAWVLPTDEDGFPFAINVSFTFEVDDPRESIDYRDIREP